MLYVCLIHHTQEAFAAMSPHEHARMQADSLAYDRKLKAEGRLVLARALKLPGEARTVRVRRKPVVTDGPFAETKEQIIGLVLIEAAGMDEAVALAEQIPLARSGHVEVREAYSIDPDDI